MMVLGKSDITTTLYLSHFSLQISKYSQHISVTLRWKNYWKRIRGETDMKANGKRSEDEGRYLGDEGWIRFLRRFWWKICAEETIFIFDGNIVDNIILHCK